ncbi:MAG: FIST C-terminal domain-containing protein [Proteobacteria bacterium]|nr:FIST C-terminal domain-containing protein [Pseudomonadota bacterium]
MKVEQTVWTQEKGWEKLSSGDIKEEFQLVVIFGASGQLKNVQLMETISERYRNALIIGCSTAGEICGGRVLDGSLVVVAVHFEKTMIKSSSAEITDNKKSYQVGEKLAEALIADDLIHMFVLSDGLAVNGTDLVRGLVSRLPNHIKITGGLAGDGDRFQETYIVSDGAVQRNKVVAVGFYGHDLKVGYGSLGGWDPFGPERVITRSRGNELFEMDGCSALELYEKYLGKHAEGLPATGLLFPLSIRTKDNDYGVVRTILSVDRKKKSLTFAGDVPEGAYARLMKANFDRLIDGAEGAARLSHVAIGSKTPDLAIMISCVGRKMILKQRIEEEVESALEVLGKDAVVTGFYSYGELAPSAKALNCELHNQTMTITTFHEVI